MKVTIQASRINIGTWEVVWKSPAMAASAYWYADTLDEALETARKLLSR